MSLDPNTWYTVQSYGTDYNLAAGGITLASAPIITQSDARQPNALWQVLPADGQTAYLRAQSGGANLCLSNANGQVNLSVCSQETVWTIARFDNDDGSPYYIAPGANSNPRLYTDPQSYAISLRDFSGDISDSDASYLQWGFRSVSLVNDNMYSTTPGGGSSSSTSSSSTETSSSSSSSPTNTTTTTTTTTSTLSSSSSTSSSPSPTTTSPLETLTRTRTVTPTSNSGAQVTETVTVTSSTSSTSSASSTSRTTTASTSPTTIPNSAVSSPIPTLKSILLGIFGLTIFWNTLA